MRLFGRTKNTNKPLIRQIIDLCPKWMLLSCPKQHKSDKGCSRYMTYEPARSSGGFVALSFGQPKGA
ncbi:MAG TPA: hypothetical protein VFM65_06660 [Flavobacteriaceae bacterium]|nr:hypothetical protein [Flavobacteriaceae bacterium]